MNPDHFSQDPIGATCAMHVDMHGIGRRFVDIPRSESEPARHYVGIAADVDERLDWHNSGPTGFTLHHRPWRLVVTTEFPDEALAIRFEKYLKSGSGRAFTKRHFGTEAVERGTVREEGRRCRNDSSETLD